MPVAVEHGDEGLDLASCPVENVDLVHLFADDGGGRPALLRRLLAPPANQRKGLSEFRAHIGFGDRSPRATTHTNDAHWSHIRHGADHSAGVLVLGLSERRTTPGLPAIGGRYNGVLDASGAVPLLRLPSAVSMTPRSRAGRLSMNGRRNSALAALVNSPG